MKKYYSGGKIHIPSASGNISITVSAISSSKPNLLTMDDNLINYRLPTNGVPRAENGYFVSDYIAVNLVNSHGFRIVNGNTEMGSMGSNAYGYTTIAFYDANQAYLCHYFLGRTAANTISVWTADNNDFVNYDVTNNLTAPINGTKPSDWSTVKYIRFGLALDAATAAITNASQVLESLAIYSE